MALKIFQIADAVGAFVEEEVHYGEAGDESVFGGEYLPVGSFEAEVFQDAVRSFGVDGFAEVGDFMSLDGNRLPFACETDVGRNACLTQEKLEYLRVEVQHQLRAGIENGEEFVLVVFEIGGGAVGRDDGAFVSCQPVGFPVYAHLGNRFSEILVTHGEV